MLAGRWRYVIIGILCMLFFGASYAWGVFVVPLEKQFGFLRSGTSLVFTFNILCYSAGMFIAGALAGKMRFACILRLGAALLSGGFILTSFASTIPIIFLTFSFLCGTGSGICYNAVVSSVPQWFPDQPGFITGILLVGYALSTAIFGPLSHALIGAFGTSATFSIVGILCGIVLMLLSFGITVPTNSQRGQLPQKKTTIVNPIQQDMNPRKMLRSSVFWIDFFVLSFTSGTGLIVINHISPMLTEELAVSPAAASIVISIIFIFNASGRVCSGWLLDKVGFKITFIAISLAMALAMSLFLTGMIANSSIIVILASSITLFTFGSNASLIPNSVRLLFGQKYFPLDYSLMNTNIVIVSLMPTIAGILHGYYGSYYKLFVYLACLSVITIIMTIVLTKIVCCKK